MRKSPWQELALFRCARDVSRNSIRCVSHARLWEPKREDVERARVTAYLRWLNRGFASYDELWRWSVSDLEAFWASIWEYFGVQGSHGPVLGSREMPGAEWFPGATVSYAAEIFRGKDDDDIALLHASEMRPLAEWTWGRLRSETASIAAGLRNVGVGVGDRVVAYMPNLPDTVAAFLACASIGATWSSSSPDFGVESVADRFAQIDPKVLLTVDGYRYAGKEFDRRDAAAQLQRAIPSLEHTFVLPYVGGEGNWDELQVEGDLDPVLLPFDHPLWVVYSSGTTGLPKAIVHSQGGILLEHLKMLHLQTDLRRGDRLFWFTTTGWMMWNFLVGGLLTQASIVLYDGSPGFPDLNALWDLAAEAGVTCFGTSAAYIGTCMKEGVKPTAGRDLSRLRSVGSTGSPLSSDGFRWIYDELGCDTWLFSMSGGTDVCSAFVCGVPTLPVYEGEIQARALGAAVEAFTDQGDSVINEVGELVLTQPMPSMPIYLWGDDDGSRYRESYFSQYPGVWRHGDWIEITARGTAVIYGRSDSTINRGGVRMGTSEIYRAVLGLDDVVDALAVDLPRDGTEGWMPLFVVLREGVELDAGLTREIKARIRAFASPRHVPDEIVQIPEVPRTLSGKILEVPVKRILMGADADAVASRASLANPAALDYFAHYAIVNPQPQR